MKSDPYTLNQTAICTRGTRPFSVNLIRTSRAFLALDFCAQEEEHPGYEAAALDCCHQCALPVGVDLSARIGKRQAR
jgi:hypothetical protein